MRHLLLCVAICTGCVQTSRADFPTSQPYASVRYRLIERRDPPNRLHVVTIDLRQPAVAVVTPRGGPDPDGEGPYQTTLLGPLEIADRDGLDVVVNGDFFGAQRFKNAEGKIRPFHPGDPATAHGPAETDGVAWAAAAKPRPALVITRDHKARIEPIKTAPADAEQVVAGSALMIADGKVQPMTDALSTATHPRTAVGLADEGNTLVIVVDDGRWKEHSVGTSLPDLAKEMLALGCTVAVNLDGGGSTEMALRDPATGTLVVVNHPSDLSERPVANVLGVRIAGTKRIPRPTTHPATAPVR